MKLDFFGAINLYPDARGMVYEITSPFSDKPYHGKTVNIKKRWRDYHSAFRVKMERGLECKGIYAAFKKYGIEHFTMRVLYTGIPKDVLSAFEKWVIADRKSYYYGYNLTKGGEGAFGRVWTEESRMKAALTVLTAPARANNKSGYKGVSWIKREQKWRASIRLGGVYYHLGFFDNIGDAVAARTCALEAYLLRRELPPAKIASEYKGVYFAKPLNLSRPWRARAGGSAGQKSLGYYPTELEAAQAVANFYNCKPEDLLTKRAKKAREASTPSLHTTPPPQIDFSSQFVGTVH